MVVTEIRLGNPISGERELEARFGVCPIFKVDRPCHFKAVCGFFKNEKTARCRLGANLSPKPFVRFIAATYSVSAYK